MYKHSPFYVETQLGKLELTKGSYLTLQKRKNSAFRTLAKTKVILKDCPKPTVKRQLRNRQQDHLDDTQIVMLNQKGQPVTFGVDRETDRLWCRMLGSLPTIEMAYDNDAESEWGEVQSCVNNLSMSLSLATFDHNFKRD